MLGQKRPPRLHLLQTTLHGEEYHMFLTLAITQNHFTYDSGELANMKDTEG